MISMIVAKDLENGIGAKNSLMWHISADLKKFKEITTNHKIIMGRKTFESLPKLLPNREHIVITNNSNYFAENIIIEKDIKKIVDLYKNSEEEVFIIGGAMIYNEFLPYCDKIYVTEVNEKFNADVFFPKIGHEFSIIEETKFILDKKSNLEYKYLLYVRK